LVGKQQRQSALNKHCSNNCKKFSLLVSNLAQTNYGITCRKRLSVSVVKVAANERTLLHTLPVYS